MLTKDQNVYIYAEIIINSAYLFKQSIVFTRACTEALKEKPAKDLPTETLVKLLTLTLKCNNFEFKGKHYMQVDGTGKDTQMVRVHVNIIMGWLGVS